MLELTWYDVNEGIHRLRPIRMGELWYMTSKPSLFGKNIRYSFHWSFTNSYLRGAVIFLKSPLIVLFYIVYISYIYRVYIYVCVYMYVMYIKIHIYKYNSGTIACGYLNQDLSSVLHFSQIILAIKLCW